MPIAWQSAAGFDKVSNKLGSRCAALVILPAVLPAQHCTCGVEKHAVFSLAPCADLHLVRGSKRHVQLQHCANGCLQAQLRRVYASAVWLQYWVQARLLDAQQEAASEAAALRGRCARLERDADEARSRAQALAVQVRDAASIAGCGQA